MLRIEAQFLVIWIAEERHRAAPARQWTRPRRWSGLSALAVFGASSAVRRMAGSSIIVSMGSVLLVGCAGSEVSIGGRVWLVGKSIGRQIVGSGRCPFWSHGVGR
jgi:hypothetical protein